MKKVLSQILLLCLIALVPLAIGEAEEKEAKEAAAKEATEHKADFKGEESAAAPKPAARRASSTCLASEEIIQDVQAREEKLKEREAQLVEREKELEAQNKVIAEQLAKLDAARSEIQGVHAKALAEREEQVNKLIETFETMSPKAAAAVMNGVDDQLAVTALSRLPAVKAGKILANLNPSKSSKLSELMAFGNQPAKEKARGESADRAPANSKR